jgi:hypothetical protein
MSHTCGNILLHLIFGTRERRPLITPEFRDDLFAFLDKRGRREQNLLGE